MSSKKPAQGYTKKSSLNPLESIKDFSSSLGHNTVDSFKNLGSGMLDQLLGYQDNSEDDQDKIEQFQKKAQEETKQKKQVKKEANLFNYQNYHENVLVRKQIQELVEQIRKEIAYLKQADKSLLSEVKDIENLALNSVPEKPGVYHVRFLEIVLRILQSVRMKVGESRTWMQALISKKKKRGSLFAARSKKQGTQYSLSQELTTARSVQ